MTEQKKITFIGGGSMTHSLITGIMANGYDSGKLCVSNPSDEKLDRFRRGFLVRTSQDNREAAADADILVLAVKPNQISPVCEELRDIVRKTQPLVISVATGVTVAAMAHILGGQTAIIRAMPNTPVSVRKGATGLYASAAVSSEQREWAESIMLAVGLFVWVRKESQIDAVTALSGSGPAYIFLIIEALQEAGERLGLSAADAHLLTAQTVLGAARMVLETGVDVVKLRQAVTSPAGTTEQAIKVLEAGNIRGLLEQALQAAMDRAKELSRA